MVAAANNNNNNGSVRHDNGSPKQHGSNNRRSSFRGLLRPSSPLRRYAPVAIALTFIMIIIAYLRSGSSVDHTFGTPSYIIISSTIIYHIIIISYHITHID